MILTSSMKHDVPFMTIFAMVVVPPKPIYLYLAMARAVTEAGIHHSFRALKRQANKEQWDLIADLSFHDLRHDFAHQPEKPGGRWRRSPTISDI